MDQDKKKTRKNESSFLNFDPQEYFGSAVDQKIEELKEEAEAEENKELGMQIINEASQILLGSSTYLAPCWNLALVPLFWSTHHWILQVDRNLPDYQDS